MTMSEPLAFEPEEIVLAGKVLALLDADGSVSSARSARYLRTLFEQLVRLRELVSTYPSLLRPHQVGGERRDVHSLVDAICCTNPYTIEAVIPTRAVVGRAFQVARFNLLNLLVTIVRHHFPGVQDDLAEEINIFLRQAVASIIAEDILVSIAGDEELENVVRRRATYVLVDLWENRTSRPLKDFFPVLISVWEAKSHFSISYGTLAGTSEMLDLMRQGCHQDAIEYFTSEQLSLEEEQALMELFFNATHEELVKMRAWMAENRQQAVDAEDVARIFEVPLSRLHRTVAKPKDMFFTYRERQLNAYSRQLHQLPGPKRTAEEYLMIFLLRTSEIPPPAGMKRKRQKHP